jgi:uroporphyrinogen III methyltransferase/synthase
VIEMPALVITPPSSWDELDHAIAQLYNFDWLILTSSNGVEYFLNDCTPKRRITVP